MPTQCVISDCKSGKKKSKEGSEPESVQTFPFPTETTAKNRWLRHCDLGENIGFYSRLCAKHFQKGCFLSPSENVDDFGRPRTKLRLKDGAVPTIFSFGPTPSLSKRRASKHSNTEVTPDPRKIPRIDHSLNLPPPAVVSNTPNVPEPAKFEVPLLIDKKVRELIQKRIDTLERENNQLRVLHSTI